MSIDASRLQVSVQEQERWRRKLSVTVPAAVPAGAREDYLRRAGHRRAVGAPRRLATRVGRPPQVRRNHGPRPDRDTEASTILKGV